MSNVLLTDSVLAKRCLMSLKNKLSFTSNVSKEYISEHTSGSKKKGDTVSIRKPSRYTVTEGATLSIQDSVQQSIPLKLDKHFHVGMQFSQADRTLSLEKFDELHIDPAMEELANHIDYNFQADVYKKVFNTVGVPSSSVLPSSLKGFTQAKARMNTLGAPSGMYSAIIDPMVEAEMVEGLKGLFQSSEKIKEQYESGYMGIAGGSRFSSSANVVKHTIGALGGTPLVNGSTSSGATSVVTDGWSPSVTGILKAGDVISFAGVYYVNPKNRQTTGQLAQFSVQEDVDSNGSGQATIQIDRAILPSGQYQNVTALPADNAVITVFGHASSYAGVTSSQNLVFNKAAFALGAADIELPTDGAKASRAYDKDAGLSLTMTSQFDITNYRNITRIDFLGGWECVYPELAARVVGQPA